MEGEEWALDNGLSISVHVHGKDKVKTSLHKHREAGCSSPCFMRGEGGHSQAELQTCGVEMGL